MEVASVYCVCEKKLEGSNAIFYFTESNIPNYTNISFNALSVSIIFALLKLLNNITNERKKK